MLSISFIAVLFLSAQAADAPTPAAFTEGTWVQSSPSVRVRIHSKKGIDVTLNRDPSLPKAIGITLFSRDGKPTTIELRAIDGTKEPSRFHGPWRPIASGSLTPEAQSFVGFELRIPFSSKPPKILRSQFMERPRD